MNRWEGISELGESTGDTTDGWTRDEAMKAQTSEMKVEEDEASETTDVGNW